MRCSNCGAQIPEGNEVSFCPECGAKVEQKQTTTTTGMTGGGYMPPTPSAPMYEIPESKPSTGLIVMVVIALLAMIALLGSVIYFVLVKDSNGASSSGTGNSTVATETTTEAEEPEEETTEATEEPEPVHVYYGTASEMGLYSYHQIPVNKDNVTDTSHIPTHKYNSGNTYVYNGFRAMDGNSVSSWQTDEIPATLTATLDGTKKIKAIGFKLGNWRNEKYFYMNRRPKSMNITVGNTFSQDFSDGMTEWAIVFSSPVEASYVKFELTDYYTGSGTQDTCVTEITLYEE